MFSMHYYVLTTIITSELKITIILTIKQATTKEISYFMTLQPIHDNILVKLQEETKATSSLIIVPNETTLKYAEVVAVGEGYLTDNGQRTPMTVKVGDKVLLDPSAHPEVLEIEGQQLVFLKERHILAIVK